MTLKCLMIPEAEPYIQTFPRGLLFDRHQIHPRSRVTTNPVEANHAVAIPPLSLPSIQEAIGCSVERP